MSRPDPRLLVPVEALPCVPEGARVWSADPAVNEGRPWVWGGYVFLFVGDGAWLDASAPELRDGMPERLDALPWLCALLQQRRSFFFINGASVHTAEDGSLWTNAWRIPFPIDLTGLTPDEAARAVVAAATAKAKGTP